jgi:hypothetical protein
MLLSTIHDRLLGHWNGRNRLILSWLPNPEHLSDTTLTVTPTAKGKFLSFNYTWVHDGAGHEGVLLVGNENKEGTATGAFVDSWHMSGAIMSCKGRVADDGIIHLLGSYEAPPGPDWGWRFEIRPGDGALTMLMFNVSPDGAEELAVQADYERS